MFERLGVNKVIKTLVLADFLLISPWGFVNPILGIFAVSNIEGATLGTVGFATSIYWIIKSVFQIPISRYLDSSKSEADDFYSMIIGTFLVALVPIGYIFVQTTAHFYLLQIISAIGDAMSVPAWYAIFTRHIDKGKEGFEWTLNSVSVGLGAAWSAAVAGYIGDRFGFVPVFLLTALFILSGGVVFLLLTRKLIPQKKLITFPFIAPREKRDNQAA